MRHSASNQDGNRLSRREYAQILAGASVAGAAGCLGDDDDADGDTDGNADGDDADDADGDLGSPQRDSIRVIVENLPGQSNFNEWAADPQDQGIEWLTELAAYTGQDKSLMFDGTTFDAPHHPDPDVDEVEAAMLFSGREAEAPFDRWWHLRGHDGNDPLTYHDGTEIDAQAFIEHERVWYGLEGGHFNEADTFNYEVEDDYVIHSWRNRGEAEGQTADPTPRHILIEDTLYTDYVPYHPDFTTPYNERYADAGSEDELDEITEDLSGDRIGFERWAEEGFGSGLYELDPDQIGAERAVLTQREDHPNAEHATIDEVELVFAEADRRTLMVNEGNIDAFNGIVQAEDGRHTRQGLPDHIQEIQRYRDDGTDQLLFNMNDQHLGNLWVRRAIVAAVDWIAAAANGWGPERSIPLERHVFMGQLIAERTFSDEFLDSLYTYPMQSDYELAEEWMQRGGYTREDGIWVSPEGDEVRLPLENVTDINDYVGAAQTIEANLQEFGFGIDFQGLDWGAWVERFEPSNVNFTMSIHWGPRGSPWAFYDSLGDEWEQPLVGGDPEMGNPNEADPENYGDVDHLGRPFEQQIPTEVGSIEAPEQAGRQPDLEGAGIDAEHLQLPRLVHTVTDHEASDEELQEAYRKCARYYNYYVPSFLFHNFAWGYAGNVRDFNFPPQGHAANYEWGVHPGTQSGVFQAKYDDDFPEP